MFLARVLGSGKQGSGEAPGLLPRAAESSGQQSVASGQAGQVCSHKYTYAYLCIYEFMCSCGPWPPAPLCPWDWLPSRDSSVGTW